jgi:hypothetical protein
MVNGVEKDSFPIGKTKFGLASYADLALGIVTVPAKEQLDRSSKTAKDRPCVAFARSLAVPSRLLDKKSLRVPQEARH